MSTMQQAAGRTVVGTLVGMEPRNGGWMRFSVQEQGMNYPVKADTKKPEIIAQCQALMGNVVTVQIGEQQSQNINPNNNQPYINRYINAIALAAPGTANVQPAQQVVQPQQNGGQAMVTRDHAANERTRELRIMRQTAGKCAAEMYPFLPEEQRNPKGMVEAAELWLAYFVYGPTRFGVAAFDAAPEPPAPPPRVEVQQGAQQPATVTREQEHSGNFNLNDTPCPGCGAAPGEEHAADCIPY